MDKKQKEALKKQQQEEEALRKQEEALDNLAKPYVFFVSKDITQLTQTINIVATKRGHRVINHTLDSNTKTFVVLMEKQ